MIAQEVLKLEEYTTDYYSCDLCKMGNDVILDFGSFKLNFKKCLIFKYGYPNEEIYMHYDYYSQDPLRKYHLFELKDSEWIKELMKMNSVHDRHTDEIFSKDRHFMILFEDEVFECVAKSYEIDK